MTLLLHIPCLGLFNYYFSPLNTLAPSLHSAPLNCRVVAGVTLGSGWPGVWFQCCLQLPLVVCCLVLSCQGLRILGRADKEEMAFSTAGWEYDDGSVCVCVYTRTCICSVCSLHTHTAGPILSCYAGVTNTWAWAIAYIFCFKRAYKYYV